MAGIRDVIENLFGPRQQPVMRAPVAPNPAQEPSPEFQELMSRLRGAETQMPELPPAQREQPRQARSADNQMVNIITEAAQKVGVDPDYLIAKDFMESSPNPAARAKTSSARGLFPFTKGTWNDMVSKYGEKYNISEKDINDPRAQAVMAAQDQKDNMKSLKQRLGENFEPKPLDLYITDFLGTSSGAKFIERALNNPNARAARDFKTAARRTKSIFFDEGGKARSYRDIAKLIQDKIQNAKKGTGIVALQDKIQNAKKGTGIVAPTRSVDDMVETILQHEGGYVNHPADKGGPTNWGVTHRTLADWLRRDSVSPEEVRALDRETAKEIYLARYFHGPRIDTLPPSIQPQLFDMSINHGPRNAVRMLQDVLNMAGFTTDRDGIIGPQTRRQLDKALGEMGGHLINALAERREQFYEGIVAHNPKQAVFLRNWRRRARSFRTDE